jgi:lipopolysaccharide export LptBFGC system permease protein LptF
VSACPPRARGPRASTYIIDRYLVGQYVTFLLTGTVVVAVLVLVVDLIQYLDRFLRAKPRFIYIVQHLFYRLPGSLYEGLPLIVLVSTVFLFLTL